MSARLAQVLTQVIAFAAWMWQVLTCRVDPPSGPTNRPNRRTRRAAGERSHRPDRPLPPSRHAARHPPRQLCTDTICQLRHAPSCTCNHPGDYLPWLMTRFPAPAPRIPLASGPPSPVTVGGSGDCWKRIPGTGLGQLFGSRTDVTLSELKDWYENVCFEMWPPYAPSEFWVVYERTADGDLHVVDATATRGASPATFTNRLDGSHLQNWVHFEDFLELPAFKPAVPSGDANDSGIALCAPVIVGAQLNADLFYESPHRNAALSPHLAAYLQQARHARVAAPYEVDSRNRHYLAEAGIPQPLDPSPSHPHPVHVAYERQALEFVRPLLKAGKWFALFLRAEKVAAAKFEEPAAYYNPELQPKDVHRYRSTVPPQELPPLHPATVWFMHDALHHLSPRAVASLFETNPALNHLIATVVIPPETLFDLPPTNPTLYTFRVQGDSLEYTPEGDTTGSYRQPLSAREWLRASSLITAQNEHLHVGVLHSRYAHHTLLISRSLFLADEARTWDMGDVTEIPFWAHPLAGPGGRLTNPGLYAALSSYATRVSETNVRDLYAKLVNQAAGLGEKYPLSVQRAAALGAQYHRMCDQHSRGKLDGTQQLLWRWTWGMLWLSLSWLRQSFASRQFSWPAGSRSTWSTPTKPLVSRPWQEPFPWRRADRCRPALEPLYLRPRPTALELVAYLHAVALAAVAIRLAINAVAGPAWDYFPSVRAAASHVWWLLDMGHRRAGSTALVFALVWWFRLVPAQITTAWYEVAEMVRPLVRPAPALAATCTAYLFGLASARPERLGLPVGYDLGYQLWVFLQVTGALLPNLWPAGTQLARVIWPRERLETPRPFVPPAPAPVPLPSAPLPPPLAPFPRPWAPSTTVDPPVSTYATGSPTAFGQALFRLPTGFPPLRPSPGSPGPVVYYESAGLWWLIHLVPLATLLATFLYRRLRRTTPRYPRLPWHAPPPAPPALPFLPPPRPLASALDAGPGPVASDPLYAAPAGPPTRAERVAELRAELARRDAQARALWEEERELAELAGLPPPPGPPPALLPAPAPAPPPLPAHAAPLAPALAPPAPAPAPAPEAGPAPPPPAAADPVDGEDDEGHGPAAGPDPLAHWLIDPRGFPTAAAFSAFLGRLPDPELRPENDGLMCVWNTLGRALGADPYALWAVWCAFLAPGARAPFADGPVPLRDLGRVFAFFRVGLRAYRVDDGGHVQPGTDPLVTVGAAEGFPAVAAILTTREGNYHLEEGVPRPYNRAQAADADFDRPVALASRRVPLEEVAQIINAPARATFERSWAAMSGAAINVAAAASGIGFGLRPRRVLAPLPALPIVPERLRYRVSAADRSRAMALARDLKKYPQELQEPDSNAATVARTLDSMAEVGYDAEQECELILLSGAAGTGKTHAVRGLIDEWLAAGEDVQDIRVHSWTQTLRDDVIRSFGPHLPGHRGANFPSGVRPLTESFAGTIIFDDAGMLWPGFIPLFIMSHPAIARVVVTFDPAQQRAPFPRADSLSRTLLSEAEWLSALAGHYATASHRLSVENSRLFGLPPARARVGYVPTRGRLFIVSNAPQGVPYLAASPRYVEVKNRGGQRSFAFADVQGIRVDGDVAIDAGGLTSSMTDHLMWPVLTRATGNIFIVVQPSLPAQAMLVDPSYGHSRIMSAILAVAAHYERGCIDADVDREGLIALAVRDHLAAALSPAAVARLGLPPPQPLVAGDTRFLRRSNFGRPAYIHALDVGASQPLAHLATPRLHQAYHSPFAAGSKSTAFDFTKPLLSPPPADAPDRRARFRHELRHVVPVTNDMPVSAAPSPPDELPAFHVVGQHDPADLHFDVGDAESRELVDPRTGTYTQAIDEEGCLIPHNHTARDTALTNLSLAKRIRPRRETAHLSRDERARFHALQRGFKQWVDVPGDRPPFNAGLYEECLRDQIHSWSSGRTIADLARACRESPVDWDPKFTRLFLKSQQVKKLDKIYGPVKPGQIIACFPQLKTFRDSVWALYVERTVARWTHSNVYLHARASPFVMAGWYARHWKVGCGTTACDYTAWDTGCRKEFLEFDKWVFRSTGVPESYISLYADEKLNTSSFKGPMPVMQFSGDRYTWLFNTYRNMALTGATFAVDSSVAACFSGDDMILCGDHRFRPSFNPTEWPMTPKLVRAPAAAFCGFIYGDQRLHVDPVAVLERAKIGFQDGRRDNSFWDSIEYAANFTASGMELSGITLAATHVAATARRVHHLPPGRFARPFL